MMSYIWSLPLKNVYASTFNRLSCCYNSGIMYAYHDSAVWVIHSNIFGSTVRVFGDRCCLSIYQSYSDLFHYWKWSHDYCKYGKSWRTSSFGWPVFHRYLIDSTMFIYFSAKWSYIDKWNTSNCDWTHTNLFD